MPRHGDHRTRPDAGMTKTQRLSYDRFLTLLTQAEYDDEAVYRVVAEQVPEAWDVLERDVDVTEPKVRITLRLDASVAKFFRAQGHGYQARINRVLATYAQMKIAGIRAADARLERWRAEGGEGR